MRIQPGPSLRMILRRPLGALLIAGEVAFSIVLVAHLAIVQRTLRRTAQTDSRLDPGTLFVVDADGEDVAARLQAIEGVSAVARVERAPHDITQLSLGVQGRGSGAGARAWFVSGTPALPDTLGLRMVDGTAIDATAADDAEPVLVTESLARALFGEERAPGRLIDAPPRARPLRVAGVVADVLVASAWSHGARHAIFLLAPRMGRRAPYLVRASRSGFPDEARRALSASRFVAVESMRRREARSYSNIRGVFLLSVGVIVLLIGAGVTGSSTMVSLFITARTREVGLRRALGARRGEVVAQLVVEALLISGAGILPGVGLAFAFAVLTGTPLRELDPLLLGGAVISIIGLTILSAWIPARRAARIPPAVAGKVS